MKDLLKTNVYDVSSTLVVVGTCLEHMQPKAFEKLKSVSNNMVEVCLEQTHINMALSKLASMLARNKIKHLVFASVDRSMHCISLHQIALELSKIMNLEKTKITHYVAENNELIEIPTEAVKLSKNLCELKNIINKK